MEESISPPLSPGSDYIPTLEQAKRLEPYASAMGFCLGLTIIAIYSGYFMRASLNRPNMPKNVENPKLMKLLDRHKYLISGEVETPLFEYSFVRRHTFWNCYWIRYLIDYLNYYVLAGIAAGIICSFAKLLIKKRAKYILKSSEMEQSQKQNLVNRMRLIREVFFQKIEEITFETGSLNDKYERHYVEDISALDSRFFEIHRQICEKACQLQVILIRKSYELCASSKNFTESEKLIRPFVEEVSETVLEILLNNTERKYELQDEKHAQWSHSNEDHLIDLSGSSASDKDSSEMNSELLNIVFMPNKSRTPPGDVPFTPRKFALLDPQQELSSQRKSHSRNVSILKSIKVYSDDEVMETSTPMPGSPSSLSYSNGLSVISHYFEDVENTQTSAKIETPNLQQSSNEYDFHKGGEAKSSEIRE